MEPVVCDLCYQPPILIGILPCNHHTCHRCAIKLCCKNLCTCPICKVSSGVILFTNDLNADYYSAVDETKMLKQTTEGGMEYMYSEQIVKQIVERENKLVCYFQNCYLSFNSMNGLKKHLNQSHKRQFCELCLQHRKCLLFEQNMFTEPELTIHLNEGEIELAGSVSIYHPFCQFCRSRFYDEDSFLRHMKNHEQCHICNKYSCNKYIYYKDYSALENHYQKSHFVCKHGNCEDSKMMQVFETEELRQFHYAERHLGQNFSNKAKRKIQVMKITGFNMAEQNDKPKDNIGVCVEDQLKSISKKVELKVQQHHDGPIDIRQFYPDKWKATKSMTTANVIERLISRCTTINQQPALENIDFFKPLAMKNISKKQISDIFQKVYTYQAANTLKKFFFDSLNSDNKMDFQDYCETLQTLIFQNQDSVYFFYIFPQLVRFFRDQNPRKAYMDNYYLRRLSALPCQIQNLIILSKNYVPFIGKFIKSVERIILDRIKDKSIDLALYYGLVKNQNSKYFNQNCFYVAKQKIYNLFRMIEKVPTHDILKLNWLLKLGITVGTQEYITKVIYFQHPSETVNLLQHIFNSDLALVYLYFKIIDLCFDKKGRFKFEKENCDTHILRTLVQNHPEIKVPSQTEIKSIVKQASETSTKPSSKVGKPVVNRNLQPQLPKLQTPKPQQQKKQKKSNQESLLGFNNPRPFIKTWDEQQATKRNMKKKKLTQEEQIALALQQSRIMYQREVQKTHQVRKKQEIAKNKVNKINDLLAQTSKQSIFQQQFPTLSSEVQKIYKKQPINLDDFDCNTKKKNKKWQQFNPQSVKKEWDQTKSRKQKQKLAVKPSKIEQQEDDEFPTLGGQTPTGQSAWYDKITPAKKAEIVEVKIKKKKGKIIMQQYVDIFKR